MNTLPATPPRAVLFDAYGTLFDVYSVAQLAQELFPGHGAALSVLWRDKQIEYTRLVTTCNHGAHYQPFGTLTRAALVYAIKKIVINDDGARATCHFCADFEERYGEPIQRLLDQYQHLRTFPENRSVLWQLKYNGIPTGILSNGEASMLAAAIESVSFTHLFDHVISVDSIRKYKTHPDAYALGEQALQMAAKDILFVSCNAWDALAATWHGYQTLWVNRYHLPFEELGTQPSAIGDDLTAVLNFFPELLP